MALSPETEIGPFFFYQGGIGQVVFSLEQTAGEGRQRPFF